MRTHSVDTPAYNMYWRHDIQHTDTKHNDILHNNKWNATLSIMALGTECYVGCRKQADCGECHYADCRYEVSYFWMPWRLRNKIIQFCGLYYKCFQS